MPTKAPPPFDRWRVTDTDPNGADEITFKRATIYSVLTPDGRTGRLVPAGGRYRFVEQLALWDRQEGFALTAPPVKSRTAPRAPASGFAGQQALFANPRVLTGQVREMPGGGMGVQTFERHGGKRKAEWVAVPGGVPDWRSDLAHPPRRLARPSGWRKTPLVTHDGKHALSMAYLHDGTPVEVAWQVVDLSKLKVSHDPWTLEPRKDFPQELQPRDRGRKSYHDQIARLVAGFNPDLLAWSATASDGAPIVGSDGVVESGNGRTMALSRIYRAGGQKAGAYRDTVKQWAKELGIAVPRVEHPVLIRVRVSDIDRAAFAQGANVSAMQGMAAGEQAISDAARMTADLIGRLEPTAGLGTDANAPFVEGFVAQVAGRSSRGQILDQRNRLSKDGEQRIDLALFAYAYGPEAHLLIADLAEVRDSELRTVLSGLLDAAPYVSRLRADIAAGSLREAYDPADSLTKTALFVRSAKIANMKVRERLAQQDAFDAPTPAMLLWLDALHPRGERASAKALAAAVMAYCALVRQYPAGQSDMFGFDPPPQVDLIRKAIAETRG